MEVVLVGTKYKTSLEKRKQPAKQEIQVILNNQMFLIVMGVVCTSYFVVRTWIYRVPFSSRNSRYYSLLFKIEGLSFVGETTVLQLIV